MGLGSLGKGWCFIFAIGSWVACFFGRRGRLVWFLERRVLDSTGWAAASRFMTSGWGETGSKYRDLFAWDSYLRSFSYIFGSFPFEIPTRTFVTLSLSFSLI